jgi:cytochrome c553
MINTVRTAAAALTLLAAPAVLAGGDVEAGRTKANTCMGCHGIPGYTNAYPTYRVPKLGGQSQGLIVAALKAYKSGERPHATMRAQATNLTDQDMTDIAAYLTQAAVHPQGKPGAGNNSNFDKAQVCAACHGPNGAKPITPDYPVLAGQYANYLEHALKEYKAGLRKSPIMAGQVAVLTDTDIKALAVYFAGQQSPLYTPSVHGKPAR